MVDSFGKQCLKEDQHLYYYKVPIPVPIMVDDALAVTQCGYKTSMMNSYLNTKSSMKKLPYGVKKWGKHVFKRFAQICK